MDTVPHFRLLSKLEGFGVKGKVLNVIKDFLTDMAMRVCVERQWSEIKHVLFGVQGCLELADPVLILFQATDVIEV